MRILTLRSTSILISILILTPFISATEHIFCRYFPGDANGDGVVNIADPLRILNFLFRGDKKPCFDNSDADNNGEIQITDAIRILQWLFQGGDPPLNLNRQPQMVFARSLSQNELEKKLLSIPEFTIKLPGSLAVKDASEDNFYDIEKCVGYKKLLGDSTEEEFFRTEWEKSQNFEGNDIKRQHLEFLLKPPNFLPGNSYEITFICMDREYEDEAKAIIHTEAEAHGAPPEPACPVDSAICCRDDSPLEPSYHCLQVNLFDPGKNELDELNCDYPNDFTDDGRVRVDNSLCEPQSQGQGGTSECRVEKMTILKTGDPPIPRTFPKHFTVKTYQPGQQENLGHQEGWTVYNKEGAQVTEYTIGYLFEVDAILTSGSDPDSCYEYQWAQDTLDRITFYPNSYVPGGRVTDSKTIYIKGRMYNKDELLKKKRLQDMKLGGALLSRDEINKVINRNYDVGIKPQGCYFGSSLYCSDNYGEVISEIKTHIKGDYPRIIWSDFPDIGVPLIGIVNGPGEGQPWNRLTGAIDERSVSARKNNFIAIIEDSDSQFRWVCQLTNMIFKNDPAQATNTKKMQLEREPDCECIKQEFDWATVEWRDLVETRHNCGLIF